MADQVTTIAALPPGYGTLAGVIYAIVATPPQIWSNIAWVKMCSMRRCQDSRTGRDKSSVIETVRGALSMSIGKRMRVFGPYKTNDVVERDVATLHILSLYLSDEERTEGDEEMLHGNTDSRVRVEATIESVVVTQDGASLLDSNIDNEPESLDIPLQIVEHTGKRTEAKVLKLSKKDFEESITSVAPEIDNDTIPLDSIINKIRSNHATATALVQASAPFDALVMEVGYKAIEMLFACAIILGSTGGAWLGITLASLFPQRMAAGLYMSSYGQVRPIEEVLRTARLSHEPPFPWPPVGTVWSEEPGSYFIIPHVRVSDESRNAIGYWFQFALLVLYRWFKLRLRVALEFPPYNKTRDTTRYILLVLVPFVQMMCWIVSRRKARPFRFSRHNIVATALYLTMLSGVVAVLILAQKDFINTATFHLVGKCTDLLAAACCVGILNIELGHEKSLFPQKWVLLWAIGVCTVVW